MKFIGLAILAICSGYFSGLILDAFANEEDSKIISFVNTGEFNGGWIPFGLEDKIVEAQSYVETFPFGGGPYLFLQNAYLSDTEVFDHALIDFTISMEQKPDGSFSNRVTECIFETDVDVNTECVVCIFKDALGMNIAKGSQYFEPPYIANTPLVLEMTEFLNHDHYITDVRNVKGVQIGICMEQFDGCTPGYWKQDQHFDSWVTYTPEQYFDEVFGVGPHVTLLDAMWTGGGGQNVILRHAPAALMNTQNDNVNYEFTSDEVIQMVQDAFANETFEELEAILVGANEQICPLN